MSRIAFDITQTGRNKAGCGFYAAALIQCLLRSGEPLDLTLLTSWGDFYHDSAMAIAHPYRGGQIKYGPRFLRRSEAARHWNNPVAMRQSLRGCDLVHINNFWHPPFKLDRPVVYTLYDMSFAENPEWATEANRIGCFAGVLHAAVFADRFVAISESTKQRFLHHFPHVTPERVQVIYPASRFDSNREALQPKAPGHALFGSGRPFLLSVGTIEPRKNQRFLLQVYERFRDQSEVAIPLVLAGGYGWLMEQFDDQLANHPYAADIIKLGYVSDSEVAWLYQNCLVNLYPSFYEGFGLPVLEGMQFGAPVICSNTTSMPEIVADAGCCLDPRDHDAWTQALLRLCGSEPLRQQWIQQGQQRAQAFAWSHSTEALLSLYRAMLPADSPLAGDGDRSRV